MIKLRELVMILDLHRQDLSDRRPRPATWGRSKTVRPTPPDACRRFTKSGTKVFSMVLGYSPVDLGALFSIRICKGSLAVTSARGDRLPRGPFFRTVKGELEWKPICLSSCR